jgi:hypothetical protein
MVVFAGKTLSDGQVLSQYGFTKFFTEIWTMTADFFNSGGLPLDKRNSKAIYLGANVRRFRG